MGCGLGGGQGCKPGRHVGGTALTQERGDQGKVQGADSRVWKKFLDVI